jgi:3',5'-cyclic AMP phosphodiesterase CpdA
VTRLLQVSDPHFGTERASVVEALLELAAAQQPEVLMLSGDVTQRARHRQFEAARHFVDRLAAPATLAIPGNHDIPLFNVVARVFSPYRGFVRAFGTDLEPVFETAELQLVTVNTARARRHKDGEVSAEQVERVAQRLATARPSQVRVVVVHQPVLVTRPEDEQNLLHGRDQAVRAWAAAGADIVMGGHIHLPYVRSLRTAYRDLPRDVWAVQAGTAVSARIRGGIDNSVNLLRCEATDLARHCTVERWDYDARQGRFALGARHELRFGGAA